MGDAGEGLIDADARIQERIDEREEARKASRRLQPMVDPEKTRALESCKLARTELQRQLALTTHDARRQQLGAAIAELDRRITQLSAA